MRFFFLALLARGPAHGYMLKQRHDALFGSPWPAINIGQIYVTMGRLERDGLVTVEPDGGRKVYALTELGHKELDVWVNDHEESATHKSDLLLRLVAATLTDGHDVSAVIAECRRRLISELRELTTAIGPSAGQASSGHTNSDSLADLLVEQAALHIQADLNWLDLAEKRLTDQRLTNQQRLSNQHIAGDETANSKKSMSTKASGAQK